MVKVVVLAVAAGLVLLGNLRNPHCFIGFIGCLKIAVKTVLQLTLHRKVSRSNVSRSNTAVLLASICTEYYKVPKLARKVLLAVSGN